MTVITVLAPQWDRLPARARRHLFAGTWVNQPAPVYAAYDREGTPLGDPVEYRIEDGTLTPDDQIVADIVSADNLRLPPAPDTRLDHDDAQTDTRMQAWRLSVLVAYPEAVVAIEDARRGELGVVVDVDVPLEGRTR